MDAEGRLGRLRGHLLRPCVELRMKREKQQVFVERGESERRRQPIDAGRGLALPLSGARILIGGRSAGHIRAAGLRNKRADPGKAERNRAGALIVRFRPHGFLSGPGHGAMAPR